MDRVLKVVNILLMVIVGMLLLTGVMVIVQGSKVDFKAADWWAALSAVATVGTFAVALIALKKAPDWIKQKRNDTGFNHVLLLMSEYDELEHDIQRLYFNIINARVEDPNFEDLREQIKTIIYRIIALQAKLLSCKRWKIEPLPIVLAAFQRLKEFCTISFKVLASERFKDFERLCDAQEKLTELKKTIGNDAKDFKVDIEEMFIFPK